MSFMVGYFAMKSAPQRAQDCAAGQTTAECSRSFRAYPCVKAESMPGTAKLFLFLGCIAALLAVALGAFGAHGLKARIAPELMPVYKTGVEYHFYHALGMILVGLAAFHLPESACLTAAGWAMLAGIVLFSGSLYLLALTGLGWLGAVTPLGGAAFICAWALFAAAAVRTP
jgi:uncharacterized membrane protein YgdD (TMEM256/DUF423 family)